MSIWIIVVIAVLVIITVIATGYVIYKTNKKEAFLIDKVKMKDEGSDKQ